MTKSITDQLPPDLLHLVLDQVEEGIYFVDPQRRITMWNRAAEIITGWDAGSVVGRRCADGILRHCNESGTILCQTGCPLAAVMGDGTTRTAKAFMLRRDGARIPINLRATAMRDEAGVINGCIEVFTNDAPRLAALEQIQELRNEAMKDPLTGLPNRRFLLDRLPRILEEARLQAVPVGVIFIDLDHFKDINDRYGHEAGDEVLRIAAATLRSNLRELDVIARWGGEEFVIIAPDLDANKLRLFAERLRALLERCEIGRPAVDIRVTASMGITIAGMSESWMEVTARADGLMYESKKNGRNRVTQG